jgi:hypothetical protein
MTRNDVAELACKLLALFLWVYVIVALIQTVGGGLLMMYALGISPFESNSIWIILIKFAPQLICVVFARKFWFEAGSIARWIDRKLPVQDNPDHLVMTNQQLLQIGVVVLGMGLLVTCIADSVVWCFQLYDRGESSGMDELYTTPLIFNGIGLLIQMLFSLYFLAGAKGLGRFLLREQALATSVD